jgi:hypothetical protein
MRIIDGIAEILQGDQFQLVIGNQEQCGLLIVQCNRMALKVGRIATEIERKREIRRKAVRTFVQHDDLEWIVLQRRVTQLEKDLGFIFKSTKKKKTLGWTV